MERPQRPGAAPEELEPGRRLRPATSAVGAIGALPVPPSEQRQEQAPGAPPGSAPRPHSAPHRLRAGTGPGRWSGDRACVEGTSRTHTRAAPPPRVGQTSCQEPSGAGCAPSHPRPGLRFRCGQRSARAPPAGPAALRTGSPRRLAPLPPAPRSSSWVTGGRAVTAVRVRPGGPLALTHGHCRHPQERAPSPSMPELNGELGAGQVPREARARQPLSARLPRFHSE